MTIDPVLADVLERSRALGLLGPGAIDVHVRHGAGFAELLGSVPDGSRVLDLGSGGGLPGLLIARAAPMVRLTLLDASERRVAFLRDAVRQMGVTEMVDTVVGRAELLARRPDLREQFDVVVARSFGSPAVTAECAAGFLRHGGVLYVSEPEGTTDRWPTAELTTVGLVPGDLHQFPLSTIQELRRSQAGLAHVPRSVGIPAKRPIF